MRENVLGLEAMGGDRFGTEVLKAELYRRAEALADLPETPLFFGRLDYGETGERLHVGRRHVHDEVGDPMVIDWRAPLSRAFYRASPADPMGLELRRRFGFSEGQLTAYEDETFTGPAPLGLSRIMLEEIERPRVGPMRDIVATIQPDQDDIVRTDADQSVCVQGAPGTGKTAVGLHRVAYLPYAYRERMRRGGVLVVGPNRAFLGYIRDVLPALGEIDVSQTTVEDLLATIPVRAVDSPAAAVIKGDARMAEVLRRALWSRLRQPSEALVLARGARRWRVPAGELTRLAAELRDRGVRYGAGRELFGHRIAHVILSRMEEAGEPCDDRTHDAVRRTRAVRAVVDEVWPAVDPLRLVMSLLAEPAVLAGAAQGLLEEHEQRLISWQSAPRGPGSARWSAADAVLLDEATDLIERIPGLAHVVIDEAQDLSAMQFRALGRRCATGSVTVLGDIAQGTTPWAGTDWPTLLAHLGKAGARLHRLDRGYRVPRQIIDYAARLLPEIAPDEPAPVAVRQASGSLEILATRAGERDDAVAASCARALASPGSIGVIASDGELRGLARALTRAQVPHAVLLDTVETVETGGSAAAGSGGGQEGSGAGHRPAARVTLVPATLAKGLEYDHVIAVEPAQIVAAEPRGTRRLYVVLTRAVSRLSVIHAEPLPAALT